MSRASWILLAIGSVELGLGARARRSGRRVPARVHLVLGATLLAVSLALALTGH